MPTPRRLRLAALLRGAALVLLTALALTGLRAGPATAADGDVSWTVRTAANAYGDNRSSFGYAVNPGGTVEDTMVVTNRGRTTLRLAVYASDGYTTDAGQLDLLTREKKSVGVGAWVHPRGDALTIAPGRSADVPFTVGVPKNATPGDHVGGLLTSLKQSDTAAGINVDRRLGVRLAVRVGGELTPRLAVEDLHVGYDGTANPFAKGTATVTYTVRNTGNALLSARQDVSVQGPFGWLRTAAGDIEDTPKLLPGERWKVKVPVRGVAPGVRLTATVKLLPLLTDASGSTTPLKPVEATAHTWAVPWIVGLLLLVVAVALLLVRRARAQRREREAARVREAVERALQEA
ncbi:MULTISPECIES: WxL protein peptidoglycan domain-containing protein [unclassified Streptomyces]|uniref:WxL protein peptidoglycan domain-containing protein n=1 Tax=unclassified Streptomyces TaxID=2593676 RepID=UPI003410EEFF